MAGTSEQENTVRRRAEILDADYVPRGEAPDTPRVTEDRRGSGVSSVTAVTACLALLALALAVSRGDGAGTTADPGPELRQEARWSAAVGDAKGKMPAEDALGAELETLSAPAAAYYSMKDCPRVPGAQVCAVEPGGAAEAAGLEPGDVIVAVNGTEIRTAEGLSDALSHWDGEDMVFSVYRRGETVEITARSDGK